LHDPCGFLASGVARVRQDTAVADNLTLEQRSRTMARIRRRDTRPELLLRRALWAQGHRGYRLDVKTLPGRPDIAWRSRRLAVFVDGAFWHGHPSAFRHGKSGAYWDEKIARNIRRDRAADEALRAMGWTVIRLWDFDVRRELPACLDRIELALGGGVRPAASP
jgi:DNA mismatch endonuclease, patch repair protein